MNYGTARETHAVFAVLGIIENQSYLVVNTTNNL